MTTPVDVLKMTQAELNDALQKAEAYSLSPPELAAALIAEQNRRRDEVRAKSVAEATVKVKTLTWAIAAMTLLSVVFVALSALHVVR